MALTETDKIIRILKEARLRSDTNCKNPMNFEDKDELALVTDLIDAGHIRGEKMDTLKVPMLAMWGISLSGREYLSKLQDEKEALGILRKMKTWAVAIIAFLFGSIFAPLVVKYAEGQLFPEPVMPSMTAPSPGPVPPQPTPG